MSFTLKKLRRDIMNEIIQKFKVGSKIVRKRGWNIDNLRSKW